MPEHLQDNRLWWPAVFREEGWYVPGRGSPDAWLYRLGDGYGYGIAGRAVQPVADGQIVRFVCEDACGMSSLVLHADGSWSIAPVPPVEAVVTLRNEPDFVAETIEGLVADIRTMVGAGEYEIEARIPSGDLSFRFTVGGGLGHFTLVSAEAEARTRQISVETGVPGETAEPVADRKWWPVEFSDEVMPKGYATPCASLGRLSDGAHAYGDFELEPGEFSGPERIVEGQTVEWLYCDDLGETVLIIKPDGSYRFDPQPPANAKTLWFPGDSDTLADSPEEFVRFMKERGEFVEGEHRVRLSDWSNHRVFRFTALDGPPRFALVPATDDGAAPIPAEAVA